MCVLRVCVVCGVFVWCVCERGVKCQVSARWCMSVCGCVSCEVRDVYVCMQVCEVMVGARWCVCVSVRCEVRGRSEVVYIVCMCVRCEVHGR